ARPDQREEAHGVHLARARGAGPRRHREDRGCPGADGANALVLRAPRARRDDEGRARAVRPHSPARERGRRSMSQPGTEMRALRQVVRDLVAEPVPSVDFDRMEDTLLRKLQCEPPRRARAPRTKAVWLAAAFAATAVAAAAVLGPRWASPESAPVGRGAPTQPAAAEEEVVQGDRLLVGQRLVTSAAPLRVEHPERASWTLAPHS